MENALMNNSNGILSRNLSNGKRNFIHIPGLYVVMQFSLKYGNVIETHLRTCIIKY